MCRLRNQDRSEQFVGLDHSELRGIGVGHNIQLPDADRPLAAFRRAQLHAGAEPKQRNGCRRGRNRRAGSVLHDGVVLIEPLEGEAEILALAEALEVRRTVVPALHALQQIAADRSHVADVRGCGVAARVGQNLIARPDEWMVADLSERSKRAYGQSLVGFVDSAQPGDVANIHQLLWLLDAVLHAVQKIDTAGLDDSPVLQLRQCGVNGSAVCKCETVHASSFPCPGARSAPSTTAGVIGV